MHLPCCDAIESFYQLCSQHNRNYFLAFFTQVKPVQGGYEEGVSCSTLALYWPFTRLKKHEI